MNKIISITCTLAHQISRKHKIPSQLNKWEAPHSKQEEIRQIQVINIFDVHFYWCKNSCLRKKKHGLKKSIQVNIATPLASFIKSVWDYSMGQEIQNQGISGMGDLSEIN